MSDRETGTFLTGGTGFLGGELLARLLERDDAPVYVLVRAGSDEEASARLDAVIESLLGTAEPWSSRAVAVRGNVTQAWLGMSSERRDWLAERVGRILHCAASVSFTMGLAESRQINVDGTRRMVELGELCARRGGLDSFVHVSTAYVAGSHTGASPKPTWSSGRAFAMHTSARSSRPSASSARAAGGCPCRSCARASWSATRRPGGRRRSMSSTGRSRPSRAGPTRRSQHAARHRWTWCPWT